MILHDTWNLELGFSPEKQIEMEPVQEHLSTDTGLLLFRQFDEQLGLRQGFAAQLKDTRSDPTHGLQQLTFFHGYYHQYQYLVRVTTCAENDQVVLPVLLHVTAHASLGAAADIQRAVLALKARFPGVRVNAKRTPKALIDER